MKRDMDLIRKLLLFFDEKPGPDMVQIPPIDGYDIPTIKYHSVLLYDAGLLRCEPILTEKGRIIDVWPFELTWAGHDFIDAARSPGIWAQAKEAIGTVGGASLATWIQVLTSKAAENLGI